MYVDFALSNERGTTINQHSLILIISSFAISIHSNLKNLIKKVRFIANLNTLCISDKPQ